MLFYTTERTVCLADKNRKKPRLFKTDIDSMHLKEIYYYERFRIYEGILHFICADEYNTKYIYGLQCLFWVVKMVSTSLLLVILTFQQNRILCIMEADFFFIGTE